MLPLLNQQRITNRLTFGTGGGWAIVINRRDGQTLGLRGFAQEGVDASLLTFETVLQIEDAFLPLWIKLLVLFPKIVHF